MKGGTTVSTVSTVSTDFRRRLKINYILLFGDSVETVGTVETVVPPLILVALS